MPIPQAIWVEPQSVIGSHLAKHDVMMFGHPEHFRTKARRDAGRKSQAYQARCRYCRQYGF
ncbi:MAG: hypothetical protein Q7J15_10745 [Candidatus Desulfaltia sp.]|nr:hypothetical protein [Candidatus Desulfaltia sp.]